MNRRSFLSMMGFVAPAVIVKPKYFFAPVCGWMHTPRTATGFNLLLPPNLRLYNDPPVATIFDPCRTGCFFEYDTRFFDSELRELSIYLAHRMAKTIDNILASGGGQ